MMTRMTFLFALLFAGLATACSPNPATIAEEFQAAINTQDVESALELVADAVVLQVDDQTITGKAEARDWLGIQAELNLELEGTPAVTDRGANYENCIIRSVVWSNFGLDAMSASCVLELDAGSITRFRVQFDEDSATQLDGSQALRTTDLVAVWTTQWPAPGTTREDEDFFAYYYLQLNADQTGRLARTPEDLSVPPDAEHTGASLVWTYEGYVLTIQNKGAASDGYCLEEEVGIFLIRKDRDGGVRFKPVEDTCSWRKFALERTASSWDPYVP